MGYWLLQSILLTRKQSIIQIIKYYRTDLQTQHQFTVNFPKLIMSAVTNFGCRTRVNAKKFNAYFFVTNIIYAHSNGFELVWTQKSSMHTYFFVTNLIYAHSNGFGQHAGYLITGSDNLHYFVHNLIVFFLNKLKERLKVNSSIN